MGMGPKDDASTASLVSLRRDQDLQENEERRAPSVGSSNTLVDANSVTRLTSGTATSLEEKLKKKSRQKVCCGVPIWLLALTGTVMLLGACLGGVIGGVLGARKAEQTAKATNNSQKVVTVTYTSDVTPMSTMPPGLLSLPTGNFRVSGIIQNQSRYCITKPEFTSTWACQNQGFIQIDIEGNDMHNYNGTVIFEPSPIDASFTYGAQAPFMPSPTQTLTPMLDTNNRNFGPALFFSTPFDKLVIVHENEIPPPPQRKRDGFSPQDPPSGPPFGPPTGGPPPPPFGPGMRNRKQAAAGEKPWFCWWNGTNMEFFLFVNQTSASSLSASSFSPESTSPPPLAGSQPQPSNCPRRIKIEEERIPDAPKPYCVQMLVNQNLGIDPIPQSTVYIPEYPPPVTVSAAKRDIPGSLTLAARASYESSCFCGRLSN
jgi:hypothetical protein